MIPKEFWKIYSGILTGAYISTQSINYNLLFGIFSFLIMLIVSILIFLGVCKFKGKGDGN